jgi:hypothetical protein
MSQGPPNVVEPTTNQATAVHPTGGTTTSPTWDERVRDARRQFKSSITSAVTQTNYVLSSLEETATTTMDDTTKKIQPVVQQVNTQGSRLFQHTVRAYERRKEFGPPIGLGTALLVGGAVALRRRRRLPGALAGVASGGVAYLAVMFDWDDVSWD